VGTVGARPASAAGGAARHVYAVNNGKQDTDQIYTAALTLTFAKVAVFKVWLPVGHFMCQLLTSQANRCNILRLVGRALAPMV